MSSEGQSQRARFMNEQAYLRSLGWGRYSYDYLYPKYLEELDRLGSKYLNGHNESVSNDKNHAAYVDELMKLNNDFAGLGLSSNVLATGTDMVSQTTIQNNSDLVSELTNQNGTADRGEQMKASSAGREGWAYMNPKEREEFMISSGMAPTYRLEAAFVHKQMVGKHKDSEEIL